MAPVPPLTLRDGIAGRIGDVLQEHGFDCVPTANAIVDLVIALATYREEGVPMYPVVFLCEDHQELVRLLGGGEAIRIGTGPVGTESMQAAVKRGAPLARHGWSIFVERTKEPREFVFGVFRGQDLPLAMQAVDVLRSTEGTPKPVICVQQIADRCVELVGPNRYTQLVYLSNTRASAASPHVHVENLIAATTRDVKAELIGGVQAYLQRTISTAIQSSHGNLVCVIDANGHPPGSAPPQLLESGTWLTVPLDVPARAAQLVEYDDVPSVLALTSIAPIIAGMLGSDGIVVLDSMARIRAYGVFVQHDAALATMRGGARLRTFMTLSKRVPTELVAAYYRSQDGRSEFAK